MQPGTAEELSEQRGAVWASLQGCVGLSRVLRGASSRRKKSPGGCQAVL